MYVHSYVHTYEKSTKIFSLKSHLYGIRVLHMYIQWKFNIQMTLVSFPCKLIEQAKRLPQNTAVIYLLLIKPISSTLLDPLLCIDYQFGPK